MLDEEDSPVLSSANASNVRFVLEVILAVLIEGDGVVRCEDADGTIHQNNFKSR